MGAQVYAIMTVVKCSGYRYNIDDVLKNANINPNEVNNIMVVNGPGSFTGVRVGVTVAKTLAWSKNIKVYPISELQLLSTSSEKKYIVPLIDARRGFVYAGIYNKNLKCLLSDQYIALNDLYKLIEKNYDLKDVEYVSYDKFEYVLEPKINLKKLFQKGKFKEVLPHDLVPCYLKNTEAEEKLNDKKNK